MRFLFVDRILEIIPGKYIKGIKHVTADDFYLTKDKGGRACFMPSLIGETLGQLAAWNVMFVNDFSARPVAGVTSSAKFHRPAYVGETILLESNIEELDDSAVQYNSIAKVGDSVVFTIDGALGPMLPMRDFIDTDVVRRQFDEINRPGDCSFLPATSILHNDNYFFPSMQFDRVLAHEAGVSITTEKLITCAAPYFPDHFPNKPVLPLTVLLECKLNLVKEFTKSAPFNGEYDLHECRKIKMNDFVSPGDVVQTNLKVKSLDAENAILFIRSEVDGKRVCVLEIVLKKVRMYD